MNRFSVFPGLIAALFIVSAGFAAESADQLQIIDQQQTSLQSRLDAGDLGGMNPRQANIVRRAQTVVFSVLDGKKSMDDLDINEKVQLKNALETINAQIKGAGHAAIGEQEVCWRERKSGTTMKVTRCGTQAERDRIRQGAREWMEKPKVCVPPGCG